MGTDLLARFRERAAQRPKRIVYPEGGDPRVVQAAGRASNAGIARPILIGTVSAVYDRASFEIIEPTAEARAKYAQLLLPDWRSRGITESEAQTRLENPMYFAAAMVRAGDADGMVGGA